LKRIILIVSITAFLFIAVLFFLLWKFHLYAGQPVGDDDTKKVVIVAPGQNFNVTAEKLHEIGIIKSLFKFKLLARFKGYDKQIKAGEYLLSPSMPPDTILTYLSKGKVRLHRLTVPEGYNIYQIASIVADSGLGMKKDFLSTAADLSFVHEMKIKANTFEGYLFPDTYYFPKNVTPKKIIRTMVKRFRRVFVSEWEKRAASLGLSIHQVVTLASIIEKETGAALERPVISSVFHNRLKKRMRLESDPTVIYGIIEDFDGNITRKHLTTWTPYNTYKIAGLPPGPIASPGIKAIEAALFPAETRFLYFVSKGDTTHKFSTNINDHNRAVRKYQLKR